MLEDFLAVKLLAQVGKTVGPLVQVRLVYLEDISGKYHFCAFTCTRDDGLDLVRGKILGFIDDEVAFTQASSADVGERFDDEFFLGEHTFNPLGLARSRFEDRLDHVEIVHQRL